jgi:hypothetical protein
VSEVKNANAVQCLAHTILPGSLLVCF